MDSKKKLAAGAAALVGLGGMALGGMALQPASAQIPAPPVRTGHGQFGRRNGNLERHPEIRRALRNLYQAKNNLQHGARDFSGHREQALDLVQRAIAQCEEALKSDRR